MRPCLNQKPETLCHAKVATYHTKLKILIKNSSLCPWSSFLRAFVSCKTLIKQNVSCWALANHSLSYFLTMVIKCPKERNFKEERVYFGLQLRRDGVYYDREAMTAGRTGLMVGAEGWLATLRLHRKRRAWTGSGVEPGYENSMPASSDPLSPPRTHFLKVLQSS